MLLRNGKEIKNIYVNGKKVLKVYNQGKVLYDSRIERKTVSGKDLKIDDCMSEYSGKLEIFGNSEQQTIATPEFPSEVRSCGENGSINVSTCNKNLFNKNNIEIGYLRPNDGMIVFADDIYTSDFIRVKTGHTYFIPATGSIRKKYYKKDKTLLFPSSNPTSNYNDVNNGGNANDNTIVQEIPEEAYYIRFCFKKELLETMYMIEDNKEIENYIEYQSEEITIPTQKPLRKIREYEDTFEKKNGKWYRKEVIEEIESYSNETIETEYISTTGELTQGATVYYVLEKPRYIEITDENTIQALDKLNKIKMYEPITYIESTDEIKPTIKCIYKRNKEVQDGNSKI